MKSSKRLSKTWLLLFLIIILAFGLRILWLDRIPIAISGDELDYVLDAKSIFLSGRDISGKWSPFFLTTPPGQFPKAELPALIVSPLIGPIETSLFAARLPFVIWGLILVIVLFLIAKKFWGEQIAFTVAVVASINPWSFYFSRTSFDVPLAVTFYYLALYILLSLTGWKILIAFPFLFLAFFSYIGMKLIFIPFVFIVCFYSWFFINKRRFTKQYLVLVFLSLSIFIWFLISLKSGPIRNRTGELLTPFHPLVVQTVNNERRLSVENLLTLLFSNKLVVFGKLFLERYLGNFSLDFLFVHGEGRATYSVWYHGLFYYLDLIFLILGLFFLFVSNKRVFSLLAALMLIAPFPATVHARGEEYALRGALLYPIFILLISFGIWEAISLKKDKQFRIWTTGLIMILYLLQLLNFLNIYFFRNPIYNSEGFGFSNRVLFRYVSLAKQKASRVLIIAGNESGLFKQNLFYSNDYNKNTLKKTREFLSQEKHQWGNIYFLSSCPKKLILAKDEVVILLPESRCLDEKEYPSWLSISQLSDGGEVYRIFNDSICRQFKLGRYPEKIRFSDFKVEELSAERFCEKFITRLY